MTGDFFRAALVVAGSAFGRVTGAFALDPAVLFFGVGGLPPDLAGVPALAAEAALGLTEPVLPVAALVSAAAFLVDLAGDAVVDFLPADCFVADFPVDEPRAAGDFCIVADDGFFAGDLRATDAFCAVEVFCGADIFFAVDSLRCAADSLRCAAGAFRCAAGAFRCAAGAFVGAVGGFLPAAAFFAAVDLRLPALALLAEALLEVELLVAAFLLDAVAVPREAAFSAALAPRLVEGFSVVVAAMICLWFLTCGRAPRTADAGKLKGA